MGKTTLTNNVGFNVQVKEGNSNIFRNLQVLEKKKTMTIHADSSATYREYILILLPDNKKLRALTSDDIQELPAIEIFKDEVTGEVDWRGLGRGSEKKSWLDSFLGLFSRKPDPEADPKAEANVEANAESSKSTTAIE
jgi:hypothetical protein